MVCNVTKQPGLVRGIITSMTDGPSDQYIFDLNYMTARWEYVGKVHGPSFISAKDQGMEHIPVEFYDALDLAMIDPNGHYQFPDPFLDSLEVSGS
jgi:hypothetical protein